MKLPFITAAFTIAVLGACSDSVAPIVVPNPTDVNALTFTAIGDSATVADKAAQFRTALGGALNAPGAPAAASGRREINWDGVPAAVTNVDNFPSFFFNVNSARGVVFSTPGTGFRVDSTDFQTFSPLLSVQFKSFSRKKTFIAVGSQFTDVHFFLSGQSQFAQTTGFGVIFSDVDREGSTKLSFFDVNDVLLGTIVAPARGGSHEFSFVGAVFPTAIVARVRITSGEGAVGPGAVDVSIGGTFDLVVMDDFIYGEPRITP
ncbi:MAG TPA: hypothetical protein VM099_06290 [Gemmatimonadaceae bacterium]|nr:hypothetical protein [Gemmatimonadaceae bacterium]